jgi:FtsH-binding integral membrane protein
MEVTSVARVQQRFIQRVFNWMFVGLLMTGAIAFILENNHRTIAYFSEHMGVVYGLIFAELALVFILVARINKMSATAATLLFFIYAALNGVTLSLVLSVYTTASIVLTFAITAGMFGIMAVLGYVTKRDLSKLGSIFLMLLIGLILATIVNLFLQSSGLTMILSYLGVIIFCGLTAYDMQKIKEMGRANPYTGEMETNAAIIGALALYLDFINLFLYLLRIFGNRD